MTTIPFAPLLGGWLLETWGAATVVLLVAAVLTALIPSLCRSVRTVPRPRDWPTPETAGGLVLPPGQREEAPPVRDSPAGSVVQVTWDT